MTITGAGISSSHPSAIKNPKHEEHARMLVWISGAFDPECFDLNEISRTLRIGPALRVRPKSIPDIPSQFSAGARTRRSDRLRAFGYRERPKGRADVAMPPD